MQQQQKQQQQQQQHSNSNDVDQLSLQRLQIREVELSPFFQIFSNFRNLKNKEK